MGTWVGRCWVDFRSGSGLGTLTRDKVKVQLHLKSCLGSGVFFVVLGPGAVANDNLGSKSCERGNLKYFLLRKTKTLN